MKKKWKRKRNTSENTLDAEWNECFGKVYQLPYRCSNSEETICSSENRINLSSHLKREKERLNLKKSELNDVDIAEWHKHTTRLHKCGMIPYFLKKTIKAEIVTQAWAKFYTILNRFPEMINKQGKFISLHLCEAPGAFVTSLNHFIATHYYPNEICWKWFATTLNPYYEGNEIGQMVTDDRLLAHTLKNWDFTDDFSGDVMNSHALKHFTEKYKLKDISFITADGSIDCSETPDEQELIVLPLILWEAAIALSVLRHGGSFVLKIFTVFEQKTISLLLLLWRSFDEVFLIKPGPSKSGNSEVYVVCLGFCRDRCHGDVIFKSLKVSAQNDMIDIDVKYFTELPKSVSDFFETYVTTSCRKQVDAIESNLYYFSLPEIPPHVDEIRKYIASRFLKDFNLCRISNYLTPHAQPGFHQFSFVEEQNYKVGSYNQRQRHESEKSLCYSTIEKFDDELSLLNSHSISFSDVQLEYTIGKPITKVRHSLLCSFLDLQKFYEVQSQIVFPPSSIFTPSSISFDLDKHSVSVIADVQLVDQIKEKISMECSYFTFLNPGKTDDFPEKSISLSQKDAEDILRMFLCIADSKNNKTNLSLMLEFMKALSHHKQWIIYLDSIILTNFTASLLHFVACMFGRLTYTITNSNSVAISFCELNRDEKILNKRVNDLEELMSKYSNIPDNRDILMNVPINVFMQSELRKYMRHQNHSIVSALTQSKLQIIELESKT